MKLERRIYCGIHLQFSIFIDSKVREMNGEKIVSQKILHNDDRRLLLFEIAGNR
jgi:hypothetical protein